MLNGLTKNKFKLVFTNKFSELSPEITSVQLPGISLGTIAVETRTISVDYPSGDLSFNPLTISFFVEKDMKSYKKIINWMFAIRDPEDAIEKELFEEATLQIYTPDGKFLRLEIQFSKVFPIEISDIDFESQTESDVPEIATVTFRYHYHKFLED